MLEPNADLEVEGVRVRVVLSLLYSENDVASVIVSNPSGFTCKVDKGHHLGSAEAWRCSGITQPRRRKRVLSILMGRLDMW